MSIALYSKYRRQGLRRAWHLAGMREWCANVGGYLLAFIAALLFVQWVSDQAIAEDAAYAARQKAEQRAAKAEATWLSCLNHKGVWIDGRLHTCTLADTHLAKADFK